MNGRMIFGILWIGLAALISCLPYTPHGTGSAILIAGNVAIGALIALWGMAAKGYFSTYASRD